MAFFSDFSDSLRRGTLSDFSSDKVHTTVEPINITSGKAKGSSGAVDTEGWANAPIDGDDLEEVLGGINKRLFADYQKNTVPQEDKLINQLEGRDTTQRSLEDAIKARAMLDSVDQRNKSRVRSEITQEREAYDSKRSESAGTQAAVVAKNQARLDDEDYKLRTLQSVLDQGNQLRNNAVSGAGMAANLQQTRKQQNQAAEDAADARQAQMLGMAGTAIGTAYGGPIGGAIGGAAGSFLSEYL